jgi:hypothetical protein
MPASRNQNGKARMQPTLIRFGPDMLEALRAEARASGVSVAQFVREASLARMAHSAGLRGDSLFDSQLAVENRRLREENEALRAQSDQILRQSRRRQAERDGQAGRRP